MGRVDEAMRRAAAAAAVEGEPVVLAPPPAALDTPQGNELEGNEEELFPQESETPEVPAEASGSLLSQSAELAKVNGHNSAQSASASGLDSPDVSTIIDRVPALSVEKLVVSQSMSAPSREQYRRLAAALHAGQASTGLKVIMIASAVPAEGKTLTASNLALTMSESYHRRTLLIDADLRKPSLDSMFGIVTPTGLSEGLQAEKEARLPVQQVSENLAILPAGRASSDPMAGLTSPRMRRLLEEARQLFDWIIIDTPPIILLPDAHLLASMVDGALLVIRADSTPHDLVRRAVEAIQRERVLGVVLNGAKPEHQESYGAYSGYYQRYSYQPAGLLKK